MSSELIEFNGPSRFVIGTVGVPGEREFYLQVEKGEMLRTFALEKAQASALADRAYELLKEIGEAFEKRGEDNAPLKSPIESEFALGIMSLTWQSDTRLIMFEGQELQSDDESASLSMLRVHIAPKMLAAFVTRTRSVVAAGRQPCIFCGGPVDVSGHLCPRANGYRRQP